MKTLGNVLLFLFAFAIGIASLRYLNFEVRDILQAREEALKQITYQLGFYSHVLLSPIALLLGPFQFMPKFRQKYKKLHRNMGKVYVVACLLGGISGCVVAFYTFGGWLSTIGFFLLGVLWFYTTLQAFLTIRQRKIQHHRVWMHRSYALAWAAVSLRLWLPLLQGVVGLSFVASYQTVAWLCWVPNLILIEWILYRSYKPKQLTVMRWA